ncbi:MAG: arginine deiminase family protein [Phycisphaerae bacterium]|jgi:N-dimethylarginine dimethylaminohydrolase
MTDGCQSDVGAIRRLLIKHVRDAFVSDQAIERQWQALHYRGRPHLPDAIREYDCFVTMLERLGIELHFLPVDDTVGLDSLYARDASIACANGMILCNMGKAARRTEPAAQAALFRSLEIPIHGAVTGKGRVEGGDVVWLDQRTLAVGRGYRTNDEGIRQLRVLLADCIDELVVVPLPHWRGPDDVFHLMSMISPIDRDLALVYSPLLPVPFRENLRSRGFTLIEVPDDEYATMACNVLAVAPRECIMLDGNPETRALLQDAGAAVSVFDGREICFNGAGGPTCLTRPIRREI